MAVPIKLNLPDKTNFVSRPSIPAGQKQSANDYNAIKAAVTANYDRLILDWTTDILVNQILTVGQYILFTDNVLTPITWNGANAEELITGVDSHFLGAYASEAALNAAHPAAEDGDYALVDVAAADAALYIWDETDTAWIESGITTVVPDATASVKGIVELATPAEVITGTDTTRAVTPEGVQAKMDDESLAYVPADELTTIAGVTLENDITVSELLTALEIPGIIPIHVDAGVGLTLTNMTNALAVLPLGLTFHYTRFNTVNVRRMRLVGRVVTGSASANNPRMYIQYSITAGVSYVTLGAGTIASGDVVSLVTGALVISNWITVPVEARGDSYIWRVVTEGGDAAADPVVGNVYIEYTT